MQNILIVALFSLKHILASLFTKLQVPQFPSLQRVIITQVYPRYAQARAINFKTHYGDKFRPFHTFLVRHA